MKWEPVQVITILSLSHFHPWFNHYDVIVNYLEVMGLEVAYSLLFKICKLFTPQWRSIKTYWVLHYIRLRLHPRRTLNLEQNWYFIIHFKLTLYYSPLVAASIFSLQKNWLSRCLNWGRLPNFTWQGTSKGVKSTLIGYTVFLFKKSWL